MGPPGSDDDRRRARLAVTFQRGKKNRILVDGRLESESDVVGIPPAGT
jgi:hypothetical protein